MCCSLLQVLAIGIHFWTIATAEGRFIDYTNIIEEKH